MILGRALVTSGRALTEVAVAAGKGKIGGARPLDDEVETGPVVTVFSEVRDKLVTGATGAIGWKGCDVGVENGNPGLTV